MHNVNHTEISGNNMNFLAGRERSPHELVAFLNRGAMYRSFKEVLSRACPNEALEKKLVCSMAEITGESPASVARKARNWLSGRNVPKSRETLFQICFALELDEEAAKGVLGAAAETGIHYRNPDELAYAFALRTGRSYQEAVEWKKRIRCLYFSEEGSERKGRTEGVKAEPAAGRAGVLEGAAGQEARDRPRELIYTRQLQDAFSQVTEEQELLDFFEEYKEELGALHETAYESFRRLLDILQQPEGLNGKTEPRYTIEEVMRIYLRMHVPETRNSGNYTLFQKLIRKYWPNETSLLNMKNRKEDVTRKVMILLFLITEEFDFDQADGREADGRDRGSDGDYYVFEQEEDADTVLERRIRQMNLYLNRFGMNLLDPGNLFDYLTLYAMKSRDGEPASGRMEQVLELLFEEPENGTGALECR